MKENLSLMKRELEEHLNSINENTSEIQSIFGYFQEIETKIDKLSRRLDQMQIDNNKIEVIPLNQTEKKIFLVLYTEEMPLSFKEVAQKTKLSLSIVHDCISRISYKNIPLMRSFCDNQMMIKLSPEFKEMQAKQNLVNLSLSSFM